MKKLYKRRTRAQRDLNDIERDIARLEGRRFGGRRGGGLRAHNERSLADTLEDVLRQGKGPMQVKVIVEAVQRTGYRSNAAKFSALVNQTLIKNDRFKQVDRGIYQLRNADGGRKAKGKSDAAGQAA